MSPKAGVTASHVPPNTSVVQRLRWRGGDMQPRATGNKHQVRHQVEHSTRVRTAEGSGVGGLVGGSMSRGGGLNRGGE